MTELDLELPQIRKRDDAYVAVEDVSLKVPRGQFVCLLGPSDCGKTTTLRRIAGLEQIDRGDILIGGASDDVGRDGGSIEQRTANVLAWNARPKNQEYYTEKWNEFLAS